MRRWPVFFLVVALVVVGGALIWYYQARTTGHSVLPANTPSPILSLTPSPTVETWVTYRNERLGFAMQHPPQMNVHDNGNELVFVHLGPTQREGTEVYDGISLSVARETFARGVNSLQRHAEQQLAAAQQHGTIVVPLQPRTVAGLSGYAYTLEGLGRFTVIFVPHTMNTTLRLSYLVADPQNRGYQTMVDRMLSSLLVGRTAPTPPGTNPATGDIQVDSPRPNELVRSPLTIRGSARGTWFFEASFPVQLRDGQGRVLATAPAQAQGEWMTTEFVPFLVTLTFPRPTTPTGTLLLEKDNPSGLPQQAASIQIPVRF
jgi:hypothetical protein